MINIWLTDDTRSSIWFAFHPWAVASILEGITGGLWESDLVKKDSENSLNK